MPSPDQQYAEAAAAFNRGDWLRVLALTAPLLPLATRHAGVHYLAGVACRERRDLPRAVDHLRQACALDPSRADFAAHFARALADAQQTGAALAEAERALALDPADATLLDLIGSVCADSGATERAATAYRRALAVHPDDAALHFNLATTLMHGGDTAGATREMQACLAHDAQFWRAHLALANLRKATLDNENTASLQALLDQHTGNRDARLCLHFALAKEHEDLGHYPQAFVHYRQGNAAGREAVDYSPDQDSAIFAAMQRAFPAPLPSPDDNEPAAPIFVFGMPRSGTTLVERILTSHPDVHGAGELLQFGMAVGHAWNRPLPFWRDPDIAAHVQALDWPRIGADYLASTRLLAGDTPRYVDKFPFNFLYAGFIARALPNARMVCLRRDPLDTCVGTFRQLFVNKLPYYHYTFDLDDIAHYTIAFDALLAHWRQVLPGRILEMRYESLVDAQEIETRRLLDYCGLRWDDACLHFEHNAEPVATSSSLQVRQPLFRTSIGHWRHYESELAGVRKLFDEAAIACET